MQKSYYRISNKYAFNVCDVLCTIPQNLFQNPGYMKENFYITVETLHAPGNADIENVSFLYVTYCVVLTMIRHDDVVLLFT